MLTPIVGNQAQAIASGLGLPPAYAIKTRFWKSLIDSVRNKGADTGNFTVAPLGSYQGSIYKLLDIWVDFDVGAGEVRFRYAYSPTRPSGYSGWYINPSTDTLVLLASKPLNDLTDEDVFSIEFQGRVIRYKLNGSILLESTAFKDPIPLDSIYSYGAIYQSGTPIYQGSNLGAIDVSVEQLVDFTQTLPTIITVAVISAVVGFVIGLLTKALRQ